MKRHTLDTMQLYPWLLGRAKKILPVVLAVVVFIVLYKKSTEPQSIRPRRHMSTESPTRPPVPPSAPPMKKWLVLTGYPDPLPRLCSQASMMFNSWNIAVLMNDSSRVHACDTGLSKPLLKIAEDFPGINFADSPLMLTFLFVIQQGAELIYMPSKTWMKSMEDNPGIVLKRSYSGLIYKPRPTKSNPKDRHIKILDFIPYRRHFGCNEPEGQDDRKMSYDLSEQDLPSVQVPIALPKSNEKDVPSCDSRAPPVTVPEGVFADDLQLTSAAYVQKAFWALAFPALLQDPTLPSRTVTLLKLLAQKVLWTSGQRVMLWHNSFNRITTNSTSHSQLPDRDIVVLDQLRNLYCHKNKPKQCLIKSLTILNHEVLLRQQSVDAAGAWFDALALLKLNTSSPMRQDKHLTKDVIYSSVDYSKMVYRRAHFSKAPYVPVLNSDASLDKMQKTCSSFDIPLGAEINITHPWEQFSDILLIVTFNLAHYEVIPYLELMYRSFFPYMVYCGPGYPNETQAEALGAYNFTFLSYPYTPSGHLPGSFNYECASMAMSMSYDVSGYAIMGDDVLLSIANLKDNQRHLVWFLESSMIRMGDVRKARECRLGMCDYHPHWRWWEDYKQQNLAIMHRMRQGQKVSRLLHRCYNQLRTLTGAEFRMYGGYSDFYYVPQRMASDFSELARLFNSEKVFLELTVPTILSCIDNPDDAEKLSPLYLLDKDRDLPWLHFSNEFKTKSFMHPVKWGPLAEGKSTEHQLFFCTKVLPFLHDVFGRIS